MIPITIFCVLTCASEVPLNIGERTIPEQIVQEFRRQNPGEKRKSACYIEGEFFKSCPR